jgi:hypothetical protein
MRRWETEGPNPLAQARLFEREPFRIDGSVASRTRDRTDGGERLEEFLEGR